MRAGERLIERGQGWGVGVKEGNREGRKLGEILILLEKNWEKILRSNGRRISSSFSLENELK